MKGIILAAGKGTRLYPATEIVSKPLAMVYDKPMIYYPLSYMIRSGIKDILLIVDKDNIGNYQKLLGDGSRLGISISYKIQYDRNGIASALILGEEFIGEDNVMLVLGDNIMIVDYMDEITLKGRFNSLKTSAVVYQVSTDYPSKFGVLVFDESGNVIEIEEKPEIPKSNKIVPGYYIYDSKAIQYAKELKPSARGELEITDLNRKYIELSSFVAISPDRYYHWFDTGNANDMLEASIKVKEIVNALEFNLSQYSLGYIEFDAYDIGNITHDQYYNLIDHMPNSDYKLNLAKMNN